MNRNHTFVILSLLISIPLFGQSVYWHPSNEVYDFLKRMEAKNYIVDYRDAVKPITRKEIAQFLIEAEEKQENFTEIERQQLQFHKQEFYGELQNLKYTKQLPEERWHLFSYKSNSVIANVDLNGAFSYRSLPNNKITRTRSNGALVYGSVGNFMGAYLYFRDNQQGGTYLNLRNDLYPDQGQVLTRSTSQNIEYDVTDAQIVFDISFLTLSIEKVPNIWGAGSAGNLILSTKAPSYPQIKLRAALGKSIHFTYLHGWLFSNVIDSIASYTTETGNYRRIYKPKYIAAHILEATPWDGVDIALGETEIYGGRGIEILYLLPFMFFKAAEHYALDTDNSQIFFTADINALRNYNFYTTLFIDEFSTEEFFRTDRQRNQLGFTLGAKAFDLVYPNTDIVLEYTRINPWVYNHKFPDVTFQSHDYDLGHWIGQNADLFTIAANYRPLRNLKIGLEFESLRKGGKLPTIRQYQLPTPEFLYRVDENGTDVPGPLFKRQSFGINAHYEIVRDLFIDMYTLQTRYTEAGNNGVNDYAKKLSFFIGIKYNMW